MTSFWLILFVILFVFNTCESDTNKPLILTHWMPWFQYPDNAFHLPDISGSYYKPIIGYYSSQNDTVLDWQLSLMKESGINGIIVDWYGTSDINDYQFIKETTDLIWNKIKTNYTDLKLGICYDFNSEVPNENIFENSLLYLEDNYFNDPQYLRYTDGNPIMLIFPSYSSSSAVQTPQGINQALNNLGLSNLYVFAEFRNPAFDFSNNNYHNMGVFNWVYPFSKSDDKTTQINEVINDNYLYYSQATSSPYNSAFYVGSLYHGFSDHYIASGTGTTNPYNSLGFINLDYNYMDILYNETYNSNTNNNPYIIQIPTWNDYTEGTMIEPNIPTNGCIKGCNDDTTQNPYNDLITIYQLFIDSNADPFIIQKKLESITFQYFPSI